MMLSAIELRSRCPWIALFDAIAWTLPGAALDPAKRNAWGHYGGFGGIMGTGFSRYDIAFAWAHYAAGWGPVNRRISVDLGSCTLENEDSEQVKRAYGAIVKREQRLYIGYERLARKAKGRLGLMSWAGTANMRGSAYSHLHSQGILDAVYSMVSEG